MNIRTSTFLTLQISHIHLTENNIFIGILSIVKISKHVISLQMGTYYIYVTYNLTNNLSLISVTGVTSFFFMSLTGIP